MRAIDELQWTVTGGIVTGAVLSLFGAASGSVMKMADAPNTAFGFGLVAMLALVGLIVTVGLLPWAFGKVQSRADAAPASATALREAVAATNTMAGYTLIPSYVAAAAAVLTLFLYANGMGAGGLIIAPLFLFGAGVVGQPIAFGFLLKAVEQLKAQHGAQL